MHHHLTTRTKVIIMLSVMASLFLVALDQTIISAALTRIVEEFNAYSALSWVVTAYLITTTVTTPIAGKLSDLFGRRIMLLIGVGIFVGASMLSGMSGSIEQLILWRAIQGIGGGIITANAFTIVGDLFSARERGKWQGVIGAVFGISSVVGPLLGGFLTEAHAIGSLTTDWRWTFYINVPIGVLAFIAIAVFCPHIKRSGRPSIDYAGAALLSVALATLVLAVENTDQIFGDLMDATGLNLIGLRLIMGLVLVLAIVGLVAVEKRAKHPIIQLSFFKNRNFLILMAVAASVGAAMLGSILYLTQFNQQVFGASPTQSGLMLLPMVGGLTAVSILTGQLVSKTGRYKRFMIGGFLIATVAILSLISLTPDSAYWQEAIIMVFVGMGIGAAMPLLNIAVQNEFSAQELGVATSSSQLFRGLGSSIGVAIFGAMLTAGVVGAIGDVKSDPYITQLNQSSQGRAVGDLNDANTLLGLNSPETKQKIQHAASAQGVDITPLQSEYAHKVTAAFSTSLHHIFMVTAGLMLVAFGLSWLLKERKLKDSLASSSL